MLITQLIVDEASLAKLAPEWEALCLGLTPQAPSKTPLWSLTWWRNFHRANFWARDDLRVYALRDETGRLVAVAPMMLTSRPGFGPFCWRELQFFGADPYLTQLRGLVCPSERLAEAAKALIDQIEKDHCCDWAQWRGLPCGADFAACDASYVGEPQLADTDFYLNLAGGYEHFRDKLPKKTRKVLRKCYNDLAADKINFTFRVVTEADEAPAALQTLFELHRLRAETPGVTAHPNIFATEAARGFVLEYCRKLASQGGLRIFQLLVDGKVVATRLGFAFGRELYLYFSGYAPEWAKYRIMTTLISETLKWSADHQIELVNLSSGADQSKTRWQPEKMELTGGYTHRRSLSSSLAFRAAYRLRHRRSRHAGNDKPLATAGDFELSEESLKAS